MLSKRICDVAEYLKPDRIMIDDELCYSSRPGLGCFCDEHMKLYEKGFGEVHTREELKKLIFTGYNDKEYPASYRITENGAEGEFFGDKIKIKSAFLPYTAIACVLKD